MRHFMISVAGLTVQITARYEMVEKICAEYRCAQPLFPDFSVYISPAQLQEKIRSFSVPLSEEYAECICVSDAISLHLLRFDAFLLHAAVLRVDDFSFAIVAPRGIGKTTHAHLWEERFGERVQMINGDKPIVRLQKDGCFYAYGTPFCGKEGENANLGVPLDAVILLSRGVTDQTSRPDDQAYLNALIHQVVFPTDVRSMDRGARLLANFMRRTPAIALQCTPTPNAVDAVLHALAEDHLFIGH